MVKDLISRYIWLIDTLMRYKRLTREELNRLWTKTNFSNGEPLPERTFFHYRRAIEDNFNLQIGCDKSGRYYLVRNEGDNQSMTNWILDTYALSNAIRESHVSPERIEIEEEPSAREFLPLVLEAIQESRKVIFTYAGFNRSRVEKDILLSPYFVKRYKQRWYMVGLKEKGKSIRTYALDRVTAMIMSDSHFEMPSGMTSKDLFGNVIGVSTSQAEIKNVRLMTTPMQAKYFRALPLHSSQQEEIHDDYSIFNYRLKLNYELVHEILSFGEAVTVIAPPELKAMVITELKETLRKYEK